jgi:hypothetical protein
MQFLGNPYVRNSNKKDSYKPYTRTNKGKHGKHKRRFRDMVSLGHVTRFFINGRGSHWPGVGWEVELTRRLGGR